MPSLGPCADDQKRSEKLPDDQQCYEHDMMMLRTIPLIARSALRA
jgi:hypothetical protein